MQLPNMRKQLGQGMTEYIIIVALIAIAAIGSFQFFGQTARSQAAAAAQELAGNDGSDMNTAAGTAAGAAATESGKKTMKTFSQNGDNK